MDIKKAMLDPSGVFDSPTAVYNSPILTREQKIDILHRWEYDERELLVAAEENMGDDPSGVLDEVLAVLHQLGAGIDVEHSPPTKQGGE